ncbi:precorrin-2 dehydrogenase/sirohydrochlorin ferrochelatase family protein [Sporolactobacillus putidus]|uniref:precorrin-2 dehydrogenase n=1 Tax=Sporolactobacillus putidus TaxID=492735 RepID=A0A917S042_9BACL|nr:NAD(P)-dependent oxidoreductase [Sporolactobacillus putidus]GGL47532.1 precorrin-2 dehydrogenase [Sporolactobacillus putidus]
MCYPITLEIKGRKVIVIGGGKVAVRKIRSLLAAGASITVITDQASEPVKKWAEAGQITWNQRLWRKKDTGKAFLIVAATNNPKINREIAENADANQLVNVAGQPELGNFYLPAVLHRGRLTIAVSTGGASPLFSVRLRDKIADRLDDGIEDYLDFLSRLREGLKKKSLSQSERAACLRKLLDPMYRDGLRQQSVLADVDAFIRQSLAE